MSIQRTGSGMYRAQVYDSGRNVSVSKVLTRAEMRDLGSENGSTFRLRRDAKRARERARERLGAGRSGITVQQWRDRWLTDPLFRRPKESTMHQYAEATKAFADRYGELLLDEVDDAIVGDWLAGGRRNRTALQLRVMWNDAASAKAGRLVTTNPWAGLGLERSRGRKHKQPPSEQQMWRMLEVASSAGDDGRLLVPPSFADYLEFACFTGMRPSELDALQWPQIMWAESEIDVSIAWSPRVKKFTTPKYGPYRAALVGHARDVLLRARARRDVDSPFVFPTATGHHYTPSTRSHHWLKVRLKAGLDGTDLYLATRHYFGWYALNVLDLDTAVIAEQLGHRDGGKLVEELYGHPDRRKRRARLREAFDSMGQVRPLRAVEGGKSA